MAERISASNPYKETISYSLIWDANMSFLERSLSGDGIVFRADVFRCSPVDIVGHISLLFSLAWCMEQEDFIKDNVRGSPV